MKTTTLIALSLSATANAAKFISGPGTWMSSAGFNVSDVHQPIVKRGEGALAPKRQELKNRNPHIPGAKTVKIRYGPYNVPGGIVPGGEGMIENRPSPSVERPCSSCMLLGMNAGLEYPDGADANTDTLLWLHHMVMFNIGKGAWDATCTVFGAPHLIVGSMSQSSERFFSSGNERTTTFFNPKWANVTNLGYPLYPGDRFGLITDLMNMNPGSKEVYMTIYYDYVDGHPSHMEEVKPVWLDAFQCMTSEIPGRSASSKFDFGSPPWITNLEGEVMGAGGHLHDGGTHLDVTVDGKQICSSVPTYGTDEQARFRADVAKTGGIAPALPDVPMSMHKDMPEMKGMAKEHIIAMSICAENSAGLKDMPISPLGLKYLKKGQSWTLRAYYDYNKHPGMKNNWGGMSSVMGISIMYAKTAKKRAA